MPTPVTAFIHPTAVVEDGATIGDGTKIWHFCHIFAGAAIGRNVVVGQGCSVAATAIIGDGAKIQNGVSVYDGVTIEDDVFCGPHMVFTNVKNPRAFVDRRKEFRPTRLEKGCTIGAGAVVVCGIVVGRYAMVGAGAVVTRDVPPFALVVGNPARAAGWVDIRGEKLSFGVDGRATGSDKRAYALQDGRVTVEQA